MANGKIIWNFSTISPSARFIYEKISGNKTSEFYIWRRGELTLFLHVHGSWLSKTLMANLKQSCFIVTAHTETKYESKSSRICQSKQLEENIPALNLQLGS